MPTREGGGGVEYLGGKWYQMIGSSAEIDGAALVGRGYLDASLLPLPHPKEHSL